MRCWVLPDLKKIVCGAKKFFYISLVLLDRQITTKYYYTFIDLQWATRKRDHSPKRYHLHSIKIKKRIMPSKDQI